MQNFNGKNIVHYGTNITLFYLLNVIVLNGHSSFDFRWYYFYVDC